LYATSGIVVAVFVITGEAERHDTGAYGRVGRQRCETSRSTRQVRHYLLGAISHASRLATASGQTDTHADRVGYRHVV